MDWLLFLLLPGAFLVLCWSSTEDTARRFLLCTSCDEFVGKKCRKNLGSCESKYPDSACQTKEVYTQHFTGEYFYQYSILGCPKRCVEYIRITEWEKNVFFCCNESHCNSLRVKDQVPFQPFPIENF
uniref:Prostate and testis expressed 2 n=1 Tax=Suricata suricatta TaxID=37032 RepID=A0A673UHR2_SURSU